MNAALTKSIKILLFLFLLFASLYYARPFLVPLVFGAILAMLLLPLSARLQRIGLNRVVAIVLSIIVLLAFFAGIITLLSWQVSDMLTNATRIEDNINEKVNQIKNYAALSLHISVQQQQQLIHGQGALSKGIIVAAVSGVFASLTKVLTNFLLVLIYIFLFMYFRSHLKKFVMKLVPDGTQSKTMQVIDNSRQIAQKYITGLAMMIVYLWIMYSIGFSIVGIKNPVFFAILCGLLEIVPFVGNITGSLLTMLMTLAQGGSLSMVMGIAVTYGLVQFIQSYIIQPLVVGKVVNINPLFSIAGIVGGGLVWGIPGMILVIPLLAILKIVFDNIEPLQPYGFLIGDIKDKSNSGITKIKRRFSKKV